MRWHLVCEMQMKKYIILMFAVLLGLSWYTAISDAINRPKHAKEHIQKAAELEEKEIYVDAVTEYEQALEYAPDDVSVHIRMAKAYLNSGNTSKFISGCEETAETYQDQTEALDMLMKYYLDNDYENKAVKYLEDFTESYPDNKNAGEWFAKLKGSYTELYCRYDEMGEIVNDSMVVKRDGLYGIIDDKGQEIIETKYEEIHPFSEDGFALARKEDGTYMYIDRDGQTRKVPDTIYKELGIISSERAAASKDGKYGYLDEDMEPVGKFTWNELTGIKGSTGAGKKDGKWVLVNKKGEAKGDQKYHDVIKDENGFCSNQKCIFVKDKKGYHLISSKEKRIGKLNFDDAKAFTEDGYAAVCRDGKWGFVDSDGELVIDYTYEDAESFRNGLAAVYADGLWGYIDTDGKMIITPRFLAATHFSKAGTAAVKVEEDGEEEWKLIQLNTFS